MRPLRFVAFGDSLTEGVGDPVGDGWRGWAALLAGGITDGLWWLATAGTGWVARRCTDLLPQLLTLAVDEMRHRARGTSTRLDLRASAAVSAALTALSGSGTAAGRGLTVQCHASGGAQCHAA
jgi:lysophospholipase L1-like esterase